MKTAFSYLERLKNIAHVWRYVARADKILEPARSIGFSPKENKSLRKGPTREDYHSVAKVWFAPACNIDIENIVKSTFNTNSVRLSRLCEFW